MADTYPSTCWECSTRCGSLVTVEDGRIVNIAPNPDHPGTKGAFCVKGIRGAAELTEHPDRLLHPMKRTGARGGGEWQRLSWDEALDEIAEKFAEIRTRHGGPSLVGAVSSAYFSRGAMVALLMRSLGSPNWMMNQDLCGGCRALSDRIMGLAIAGGEDIERTRCALIVGRNPSAADPVQWIALKAAKKRDAQIVVIDPSRTPAVDIADLWIRPRPGTDTAIALAMIDVIVREGLYDRDFVTRWCHGFDALKERAAQYPPERAAALAGVAVDDIVRAARMYADGPSTFVSGHGIDAHSAGVQTFRAFHSLAAITGNIDRTGGNRRVKRPRGFKNYIDILHDPAFRLPVDVEKQTIGADRFPLWAGPKGWQTAAHNPSVIDAVLTGKPYPVRGMYISGVNIVVTYPDTRRTIEALRALDYLVVVSHTMTPTAELADIVLPKTTGIEEEEIALDPYAPSVAYTRPVLAPRGEARNDFDITTGLLERLQARGALARNFVPWRTKREFNQYLLGQNEITFAELEDKGFARFDYELGNFDKVGFKTPTGKIELYSETMKRLGLDPLPDYVPPRLERASDEERRAYPLLLLTGAREKTYHHSRYREQAWARKVSPFPRVELHPDTAAEQGVGADDWVRIETPGVAGGCKLKVAVTETTPPGILRTGMGWWLPEAKTPDRGALEINVNAAMSYGAPWDPVTGSPDTRGLPCRLTVLAPHEAPMDEKGRARVPA